MADGCSSWPLSMPDGPFAAQAPIGPGARDRVPFRTVVSVPAPARRTGSLERAAGGDYGRWCPFRHPLAGPAHWSGRLGAITDGSVRSGTRSPGAAGADRAVDGRPSAWPCWRAGHRQAPLPCVTSAEPGGGWNRGRAGVCGGRPRRRAGSPRGCRYIRDIRVGRLRGRSSGGQSARHRLAGVLLDAITVRHRQRAAGTRACGDRRDRRTGAATGRHVRPGPGTTVDRCGVLTGFLAARSFTGATTESAGSETQALAICMAMR